ncbi:helix-turn-helix transcriptional regulator [Natrinema sp. H-ect1]|uniref:helix-turn-helix transcriptional regulator n=1 Tax=Natrinema sp. H-ect1 TaxID=3242700 RepID=UPI00359E710A
MSQRHVPFRSRLTTAVGRTVRACTDAFSATGTSEGRSTARDRLESGRSRTGDATDGRTSADRAAVAEGGSDDESSIATGIVDPDDGPTSRGDLVAYGLTPAEYVRAVLVEHGGRIKQHRFADRYGWSAASLSRLLTELEDEGVIARYRVGREKVVCLPEAVPESAR